ncbi:MAG: hypothetical protein AAF569_01505 [Pseudomonadota bacterium]
MGFSSGRYDGGGGETERLIGKVEDIKNSPEKGKQRLTVRERDAGRRSVSVDVNATDAGKIKRKETYAFDVEERFSEGKYGQERGRFSQSKYKTYTTDTTPEVYEGPIGGDDRWNRFSSGNRGGGGFKGGGVGPGGFNGGSKY